MEEELLFGEATPRPLLRGEGDSTPAQQLMPTFVLEEPVPEKKLTFEEASRCLDVLGKDESGVRYAYLMITATNRALTDVSVVVSFKHVLFLDLSGNFLKLEALQVLSAMAFLLYLKAERNRVESAALEPMPYLQCLILNMNRITETCDINQPMLETLELQDNLIFTVQFDRERLENLKMVNLKGNQLIDFSGTYPKSLEKLYLNQNKISKIAVDFSQLSNLKVLHLRDNFLKKLNGFTEHLENLTYLNLRNNRIDKLKEFRKLQCLRKLETVIILGNPVCGTQVAHLQGEGVEEEEEEIFGEDQPVHTDTTRIPLIALLPSLKRINKELVTFEERAAAEAKRDKILEAMKEDASTDEETEMPTTTEMTTGYTSETDAELDPYKREEYAKMTRSAAAVDEEMPEYGYGSARDNVAAPSPVRSAGGTDTETSGLTSTQQDALTGIKEENETDGDVQEGP